MLKQHGISKVDLLITVSLFLIAFLIRINTFIDMDVAWHIDGAMRFHNGGNYLTNIFDDNSPFVFWFYSPLVLLKSVTAGSYWYLIPIYILTANLLGLFLFTKILKTFQLSLFAKRLLYYLVIGILLFLPLMNFGQREIILINFILPYFFLLLNFKNIVNSNTFTIICSLFAAFGIMQNPFFLVVIVAIDITRWSYNKKFTYFQIIFYLNVLIYFLLIHYFYPEYFTVILPFTICYESAFNSSWSYLFTGVTLLTILVLALVLISLKKLSHQSNIIIGSLATFLSLMIYLAEQKDWYSHLYPAFCFALLTNAFILLTCLEEGGKNRAARFYQATTAAIFLITLAGTLNFLVGMIREFHDNNYIWNKWITFSNQNFQNKKIFFLMPYYPPLHQIPIYSNTKVVSPWFNAWFIPALEKNHFFPAFCHVERDLKIIKNLVVNAIDQTQPDFVLVRAYTVTDQPSFPPSAYFLRNYYIFRNYQGIAIYKKRY